MSSDNGVYVIGGGGHAKVVAAALLDAGLKVAGILDDDTSAWGREISGIKIDGPCAKLAKMENPEAVIAIGSGKIRRKVFGEFSNVSWRTVIHPAAYVAPDVIIGVGTVIFAHAAIQPGTVIGDHCIVNTSASVDHDCNIGDFTHIAPGVNLAGNVTVGEETFVGIGSAVAQCVNIGSKVIIGAGAAVVKDIPGNCTAVGVPAKVIKRHDD